MSAFPLESGHCFKQEARATTRASNNETLGAGSVPGAQAVCLGNARLERLLPVASVTF